MSKSKREHNYRKEEARYSDGPRRAPKSQSEELFEKKVKNIIRSNNVSEYMDLYNRQGV